MKYQTPFSCFLVSQIFLCGLLVLFVFVFLLGFFFSLSDRIIGVHHSF